jgi:hypothetical protein
VGRRFSEGRSQFQRLGDLFMTWWMNYVKSINDLPGAADEQKTLHLDLLPYWRDLQRGIWEMPKYAGFAPDAGKGLVDAAEALADEASSWLKNKGGNVQTFRQKQLTFNESVRRVHAELLRLNAS